MKTLVESSGLKPTIILNKASGSVLPYTPQTADEIHQLYGGRVTSRQQGAIVGWIEHTHHLYFCPRLPASSMTSEAPAKTEIAPGLRCIVPYERFKLGEDLPVIFLEDRPQLNDGCFLIPRLPIVIREFLAGRRPSLRYSTTVVSWRPDEQYRYTPWDLTVKHNKMVERIGRVTLPRLISLLYPEVLIDPFAIDHYETSDWHFRLKLAVGHDRRTYQVLIDVLLAPVELDLHTLQQLDLRVHFINRQLDYVAFAQNEPYLYRRNQPRTRISREQMQAYIAQANSL